MSPEKTLAPNRYIYDAKLYRTGDGDTFYASIDLGFGVWWNGIRGNGVPIRLVGIDCPDVRYGASRDAQDAATDFTNQWLAMDIAGEPVEVHRPLLIKSYRVDGFGRSIADVWRAGDPQSLSTALLKSGNAVPYSERTGRKKK